MLDRLLAKEEWRKYQILKRLERSAYFALSKKELMDHLEISNYVLKSTVDQLIQDLEKYGLTQDIHVFLDEPFVQLEITGTASSETFLEKYVEESIGFTILLSAVLGEFKSLNEFSEKKLISYPTAHSNYKQLNKYLAEYQLEIDKKFRLVGASEKNVRLFLTELFARIYKGDAPFFEPAAESFVTFEQMTVHQKISLRHYIYVTDLRIQQQKYIDRSDQTVLSAEDIKQEAAKAFFIRVPLEFRDAEVSALLRYYYSRSEELAKGLTLPGNTQVSIWSENLLTGLIQYFPTLKVTIEKQKAFLQRGRLLHFQLLETSDAREMIQPEINIHYFQQNYPAVLNFCRIYVNDLKQNEPELFKKKKQVLFQYLFLILDSFPKEALVETINVYVDFSFGELYNQFITENLHFFHLVGAEVITEIGSADILLTDSCDLGKTYNKDCVVWLSPPRPLDWANLGQKIIQKRSEKERKV